jgi:glutamyl/glutaminyl-tRNA synthetase
VILRIEDHDRQRSRPPYEAAILEDLAWLGFVADAGPFHQAADGAPYDAAIEHLRAAGLVYACACSRTTFGSWPAAHAGRRWSGPGCPGGCRARSLGDRRGRSLRVTLGDGDEAFDDLRLGRRDGPVSPEGDLVIRDRHGNWTYHLCVVVDDARQGVDLVVRGEDLVDATPTQLRLGRLLGVERPAYLHHPLVRRSDGMKLSKSDGDTGVRELRAKGWSPTRVRAAAAEAVGLAV